MGVTRAHLRSGSHRWRWLAVRRALRAAAFLSGNLVLNGVSYPLAPAGAMMDAAIRALGAAVLPGGTGNTDSRAELSALPRLVGFIGTPDFLTLVLEQGEAKGLDIRSLQRALVTGGGCFLRSASIARIAAFPAGSATGPRVWAWLGMRSTRLKR